jgi:hypothetical protein
VTEGYVDLENLDKLNLQMKGLSDMPAIQVCQLYANRIAILDRLQACASHREASGWQIENAFYQKARRQRCG